MVERKDIDPPRALLELTRLATNGDVSGRRHLASRARLLESDIVPRSRSKRWSAFAAVGVFVVAPASFATVKAVHASRMAKLATATSSERDPLRGGPLQSGEAAAADQGPPSLTTVTIQATPASAAIYWDNELLAGNPARLTRVPDGKFHRARAEAAGYLSKTENVVLDTNVSSTSFGIELKPLPAEIGPIVVSGAVSVPKADEIVHYMRDGVRNCHMNEAVDDEAPEQSVTLVLHVAPSGRVSDFEISDVKGLPPKMTKCLVAVASELHFGNIDAPATIRVPIAFRRP